MYPRTLFPHQTYSCKTLAPDSCSFLNLLTKFLFSSLRSAERLSNFEVLSAKTAKVGLCPAMARTSSIGENCKSFGVSGRFLLMTLESPMKLMRSR